ncbi:MAG: hypothetical protein R3F43_08250 [bacterium]
MAWLAREEPPLVARARQRAACATGGGQACVLAAIFGAVTPAEGPHRRGRVPRGPPSAACCAPGWSPTGPSGAPSSRRCAKRDRRGWRALALATGAEAARLRGLACALGEAAACGGTSAATGLRGGQSSAVNAPTRE